MKKHPRSLLASLPLSLRAFSLIEILIALGLFAIIISGIITLFPVALRSENESVEETRSLFIASGVMETLCSGEGGGVFQIATGMGNSLPVLEATTVAKNTNIVIAYNASCEPIKKISDREAEAPISLPDASAVMTLSLISKPALPGIITAEVSVASPPSAPVSSRSVRRFTRMIASPAP